MEKFPLALTASLLAGAVWRRASLWGWGAKPKETNPWFTIPLTRVPQHHHKTLGTTRHEEVPKHLAVPRRGKPLGYFFVPHLFCAAAFGNTAPRVGK